MPARLHRPGRAVLFIGSQLFFFHAANPGFRLSVTKTSAPPCFIYPEKPFNYLAVKWSVHTEDETLIEACLCHDRVAQECFYQKYFEDAYRTCNRYLPQHADVMAVMNEGFLKVFQNLRSYDPCRGAPGAWIHRIMVHTAIDHIRKENRLVVTMGLPEYEMTMLAVDNEVLAEMDAEELLCMVKNLPPATRMVFNMSVMEGYSHKEIARQLDLSESTSRWHLAEAKKRLQQLIRGKEKIISA